MRHNGVLIGVLAVVALAAGCSSGHRATPARVALTPKQAAIALGRQMLDQAVLPPGAKPSAAPAPFVLRGPSTVPAIGNLVRSHRLFVVAERPYDVYQWLQRHRARGLTGDGAGFGTDRGVQSWEVDDRLSVRPANVSWAELEFGIAGNKTGPATIRVDTVVGWTAPRPASEFVAASDRVVTVTGFHPYRPGSPSGRHVTTSDPKLVAPIVRAFNQLRLEPPDDIHGCPAIGSRSVGYRVAFARSTGAAPDVVATIVPCGGIGVKVHGGAAPALGWIGDGAFANAAVTVLGLTEPHFN